jgi:hypothetical protein
MLRKFGMSKESRITWRESLSSEPCTHFCTCAGSKKKSDVDDSWWQCGSGSFTDHHHDMVFFLKLMVAAL